ncbi:MAG: YhdP family protein, partial [Alphaproteobacteria bacterium]
QGPIRLSFLNGLIEQALNPQGSSAQVTLEETVLTWSREQNSLDVQALGVELRDPQGRPLARIPELSVNFSGRALLRGLVAPAGLEIRGPRLRVALGGEAPVLSAADDPNSGGAGRALNVLSSLLQPPESNSAAGYLTSVKVINGQLAIRDEKRNLAWDVTDAELEFTRDAAGIRAEAQLTVTADGITGRFHASAQHTTLRPGLAVQLRFSELEPVLFAHIEPALDILQRIDLPLAGTVDLRLDEAFQLQDLRYNVTAGAGTIDLPELYAEPLILAGAVIRGTIKGALASVQVDSAEIDLGGPTVSLRGSVKTIQDILHLAIDAEVRDVPVDELDSLWPADIGRGARNWITRNLETGNVGRATLALTATAPADDPFALDVSDVGGVMDVSGITVHYLRPMAPVLGVAGDIRYDASELIIDVKSGGLRDLIVEEGTIAISLDAFNPVADIDLTIAGTIADALTILDMPPLGYTKALGIDPEQMGGEHRTNLTFRIPLRKNLRLDDIGVAAAAGITGFAQSQGLLGLPLGNGTLSLEVDTSQLSAWGNISLGDVPVEARWTERFGDDGGFRTRYEVSGIFGQAALQSLGLDFGDAVSGVVGAGISYAIFPDGRAVGAAELDLTAADISLPAIWLQKASGEAAHGALSFSVDNGFLTDISRFEFDSETLVATGAIRFAAADQGGGFRQVGFSRLAYGGNELFGTVELVDDGSLAINLGGQTLDLRQLASDLTATDEATDPDSPDELDDLADPPLAVRLAIDPDTPIAEVRVGEFTVLLDVSGSLYHDGTNLRTADLHGGLVEPGDVGLVVTDEVLRRTFTLAAADGGALLDALDWTSAVSGGRLLVEGEINDDIPDEPIVGRALMTDFQLIEAPLLGRLLSLASFRGIANTLNGQGIGFTRLEVPFEITEETIELPGIKLRGSELGILAQGRIDRIARTIDLLGEIAPAYTLNS